MSEQVAVHFVRSPDDGACLACNFTVERLVEMMHSGNIVWCWPHTQVGYRGGRASGRAGVEGSAMTSEPKYATEEQLVTMTQEERRVLDGAERLDHGGDNDAPCPRCGGRRPHEQSVEVYAFARPIVDSEGTWRWYAICPVTGDPWFVVGNEDRKPPQA